MAEVALSPNLSQLKREFQEAKARLRKWSCLPPPIGEGRIAFSEKRNPDKEYEQALADCRVLADAITAAGGQPPMVIDYRGVFQLRFALAWEKSLKGKRLFADSELLDLVIDSHQRKQR